MSERWKVFKQRFFHDINNLSICRPLLLSGNVESEDVAAGEIVETTIL